MKVTTDANCADIRGATFAAAELSRLDDVLTGSRSAQCDPATGSLGSVVVVPSGARDAEVSLRVIAGFGKQPEECNAPYRDQGCIVARRTLRFRPYTSTVVPILLSVSCAGIPCDATSTCQKGKCVPISGSTASEADCGDTSGSDPGAPWPMSDRCPTHVRRSPYRVADSPRFRWRLPAPLSKPIASVPVVAADGTVYFGSAAGDVLAYDGRTGEPKGKQSLGVAVGGNAGLVGTDRIAVAATQRYVQLARTLDANPLVDIPENATDVAVGPGPITYATMGPVFSSVVTGVRPDGTKSIEVNTTPGVATNGSPTIGFDGTVFVIGGDGNLYAIDPTQPGGKIVWQKPLSPSDCGADFNHNVCGPSPIATRDRLFVIGATSTAAATFALHAFDPRTGSELPGWGQAVSPDCKALADGGPLLVAQGNSLVAIDPATLATWSVDLGSPPRGCVVDGSGAVLAIAGAELVAVDLVTQGVRWRVPAFNGNDIVLGANGSVYLTTDDADLVALGY